ncbi:amino-acid N-acetyltransferase [Rhizobiaceae bacterium]|nr:amino-acid N-acetyltransferase [Rhizobiaceae bacterium]
MSEPAPDTAVAVMPLASGFDRWDELLGLVRRSFAYMDGIIDPPSSVHRLTPATLAEKAKRETVLAAFVGGNLAGCVFLADRGANGGDDIYVGKLAVEPGLQGKGTGRALMDAAERHARGLGRTALELQTRVELTGNQAVFARLGFRETARTTHEGFDRPTSVTMRKELL